MDKTILRTTLTVHQSLKKTATGQLDTSKVAQLNYGETVEQNQSRQEALKW